MIATVEVFRYSSTVCEFTFACLTQIENPQRQSIRHNRFPNLLLLVHEIELTEKWNIDKLLNDFEKKRKEIITTSILIRYKNTKIIRYIRTLKNYLFTFFTLQYYYYLLTIIHS